MFRNVLARFVSDAVRVVGSRAERPPLKRELAGSLLLAKRSFTEVKDEAPPPPFDSSLLEFLVCPLSKKPLRYNSETNELINEELGIAYPIVDGIPNMIPQEARLLQKDDSNTPEQ